MTVDRETLMAYADGELDEIARKRVEKAVAGDPDLAAEVERHRALRARLQAHFEPVGAAPVPEALSGMLRQSAKVVDLSAVREAKRPSGPARPSWRAAGAVAAALVVGLFAGHFLQPIDRSDFAMQNGRIAASGRVAHALDTQLAATQSSTAPVRMLLSFRDAGGQYCRVFQAEAQSGIACRDGKAWQVRRLNSSEGAPGNGYRQAGSETLMADAQAMIAGEPLDAAGERAALAKGWR